MDFSSPESGLNTSRLLRLSGWRSSEEYMRNAMNQSKDLHVSKGCTLHMLVLGWDEIHDY